MFYIISYAAMFEEIYNILILCPGHVMIIGHLEIIIGFSCLLKEGGRVVDCLQELCLKACRRVSEKYFPFDLVITKFSMFLYASFCLDEFMETSIPNPAHRRLAFLISKIFFSMNIEFQDLAPLLFDTKV